jgi:hypothetical protein
MKWSESFLSIGFYVADIRAVWMPALCATPRLRCGGQIGRHTCGAKCVAWRGVLGRHPNSPNYLLTLKNFFF